MKPLLLLGVLGCAIVLSTMLYERDAALVEDKDNVRTLNPSELIDANHAVKKWNKILTLSARCPTTGRIAYIESDGKKIVVLNEIGQVELIVDPAAELGLPEYGFKKDELILVHVGFIEARYLCWKYNSSQFGEFDFETNRLINSGRD